MNANGIESLYREAVARFSNEPEQLVVPFLGFGSDPEEHLLRWLLSVLAPMAEQDNVIIRVSSAQGPATLTRTLLSLVGSRDVPRNVLEAADRKFMSDRSSDGIRLHFPIQDALQFGQLLKDIEPIVSPNSMLKELAMEFREAIDPSFDFVFVLASLENCPTVLGLAKLAARYSKLGAPQKSNLLKRLSNAPEFHRHVGSKDSERKCQSLLYECYVFTKLAACGYDPLFIRTSSTKTPDIVLEEEKILVECKDMTSFAVAAGNSRLEAAIDGVRSQVLASRIQMEEYDPASRYLHMTFVDLPEGLLSGLLSDGRWKTQEVLDSLFGIEAHVTPDGTANMTFHISSPETIVLTDFNLGLWASSSEDLANPTRWLDVSCCGVSLLPKRVYDFLKRIAPIDGRGDPVPKREFWRQLGS